MPLVVAAGRGTQVDDAVEITLVPRLTGQDANQEIRVRFAGPVLQRLNSLRDFKGKSRDRSFRPDHDIRIPMRFRQGLIKFECRLTHVIVPLNGL